MKFLKDIRLGGKILASYVQNNRRSFFFGLLISLILIWAIPKVSPLLFKPAPQSVGLVGNYTLSSLPRFIQEEISYGLVRLGPDGLATSAAAVSWSATDSGKTFVFHLDTNLAWQDGQKLDSANVNYNLKGVEVQRPDEQTVKFLLKEPFAPLVNLLSQPMFKTGLIGLGEKKVVNVKFNGRFLSAITLEDLATREKKVYKFFSTENDLIAALRLGVIRQALGLHTSYGLENEPAYMVESQIKPDKLVVVFFNTTKSPFDDKAFRQALVYALPDSFSYGEVSQSPLPQNNWAKTSLAKKYPQNIGLAEKAVEKAASGSGVVQIMLTTNPRLEDAAREISDSWKSVGVEAQMQTSEILPLNFDAYLTFIDLPSDPDQYALWHSTQTGNISGYKSFKVDKLLEEGRRTIDPGERLDVYGAFEKAITEDVPAAFLYYPKVYTLQRKS